MPCNCPWHRIRTATRPRPRRRSWAIQKKDTLLKLLYNSEVRWNGALPVAVVSEAPDTTIRQHNACMVVTCCHMHNLVKVLWHRALTIAVVAKTPDATVLENRTCVISASNHLLHKAKI